MKTFQDFIDEGVNDPGISLISCIKSSGVLFNEEIGYLRSFAGGFII